MTTDQALIYAILAGALTLFVSGILRYDLVAVAALLAAVIAGVIPEGEAFTGFGHPAVITVAAVLVISRSLQNSGMVAFLAARLSSEHSGPTRQVASLGGLAALFSSFMNNVGSLALLLPVAMAMARKGASRPSLLLMPLAFASLLGGMVTLIGTPPNIIVATIRGQEGGSQFRMFDFTPVGLAVAVSGLIFISLVGWRLVPPRKGDLLPEEMMDLADYVTEVRVRASSSFVGTQLAEVETANGGEVAVIGLVRGERRTPTPSRHFLIRADDILIVRADAESLQGLVESGDLELVGAERIDYEAVQSKRIRLIEAIVSPGASIDGRTASSLQLRDQYGVNLLAISRRGARLSGRLDHIRFQVGDVLLLQGEPDHLLQIAPALGLLPLLERSLRVGEPRRLLEATIIFGAAIVFAALGLVPVQISLVAAAGVMVLAGLVSTREMYESIDWSVIVLLGAMLPVGAALESTGAAQQMAEAMLSVTEDLPAELTLVVVLVATMFLSDVINNAAAAVLMAPIAFGIAGDLGVSPDPFLMAVAVGASSAFLTPIGHQSNTLVMGPGGYKFGDYWRMGLPLELVIVAVASPVILLVWPL